PRRVGEARADDGVRAGVSFDEIDEVHRSTDTLGTACRAAHEFGKRDLGLHPEREGLSVSTVCVRLDVAALHRRDRPDGDRLLPDAKMRRALDLAAHEELLDFL